MKTHNPEVIEMAHKAAKMRGAGTTWTAISKELGVSRQRLVALVKALPSMPSIESARNLKAAQLQLTEERILLTQAQRRHRELLTARAENTLIEMAEVREMFARVFAAYRQATREIEKRYGVEASRILTQAEKSALRCDTDEMRKLED